MFWVVIVFNWNHFEMRLLDLRINFFIYCKLFVLILVVFVLFLLSLRFGQISPLAFVWLYLENTTRESPLVYWFSCRAVIAQWSSSNFNRCYYVPFRTNTLGKGIKHLFPPPSCGLNSATTILLQGWFWH